MPYRSATQARTTVLQRLWAWITLADLDAMIKADVEAYVAAVFEARRIERFWQDVEESGIVVRQTDRGWTFRHRALPAAEAWQPDPFATRETALLWAVYYLLRAVCFLHLDVDTDAPLRPHNQPATLDELWPALDTLGLRIREERGAHYWQALERDSGTSPNPSGRAPRSIGAGFIRTRWCRNRRFAAGAIRLTCCCACGWSRRA